MYSRIFHFVGKTNGQKRNGQNSTDHSVPFRPAVVVALGCDFLFKFLLAHREIQNKINAL